MRRIHGWVAAACLGFTSLAACGGAGNGGGGQGSANLNVQEQSILGVWTLVGFDVYMFDSGAHYTQGDFSSFSGSLALFADGTGNASVCLETTCLGGDLTWAVEDGQFFSDGVGVPFQFDGTTFILDYYDPEENMREIKYYVRSGAAPLTAPVVASESGQSQAPPATNMVRRAIGS